MKAISARYSGEPERAEKFKVAATAYTKKIVANFKNFEFYTGESMNPEGLVALLDYRVS